MRNPAWSHQEKKFLKDNAQIYTAKEIGQRMYKEGISSVLRTEEAIWKRARKDKVKISKRGENHHLAIYSDWHINEIRRLRESGLMPCEIQRMYQLPNVNRVYAILHSNPR